MSVRQIVSKMSFCGMLALTGIAWAGEPTTDLSDQVQALQQRVAELESRQAATQPSMTLTSTKEAPPAYPMWAGYSPDVGFVLKSGDGNFSLHPGLLLDFRNDTSYREHIPAKGGGETGDIGYDTQNGFDVTRARLTFDGRVMKNTTFFVQFQDDQGSSFNLYDAWLQYKFGDSPWSVRLGQFKDPLWHERNISESRLLAVDRSLLESLQWGGNVSRTQGVAVIYDRGPLRAQTVIDDGFDSLNTKFFDSGGQGAGVTGFSGVTPTNFGVAGRAELLVLGHRTADLHPFAEYDQFTSYGAQQNILVLGGGVSFSQAGSNDIIFHSIDAQYNNVNGLSAYGGYLGTYRDLHSNQGVAPGIHYDPGFLVQFGYMVTKNIEPFARYDYTYLAKRSVVGLSKFTAQEITVGANYYLYGQNAKITLDGSWLPNGSPVDADALGILKDNGHNEFTLRAQFQLAI